MSVKNKTTENKIPWYYPSSPMFHGIVMLLALVVAIISVYISYSQSDKDVAKPIGWALVVVAIIAFIILAAFVFQCIALKNAKINHNKAIEKLNQENNESIDKIKEAVTIFRDYSKDIKDKFFEVFNEFKSKEDSHDFHELSNVLKIYEMGSKLTSDNIERAFSMLTGENVSCCIKLIWNNENYINNYFLMYDELLSECTTICRSGKDATTRKGLDRANSSMKSLGGYKLEKISNHAVFADLIHNKRTLRNDIQQPFNDGFEYVCNIDNEMIKTDGRKLNAKKSSSKYNTILCVPIRCLVSNLEHQLNDGGVKTEDFKIEHDVVGFICVDSEKANVFDNLNDTKGKTYADFMMSYASMFYIYYNRCRHLIVRSKERYEKQKNSKTFFCNPEKDSKTNENASYKN